MLNDGSERLVQKDRYSNFPHLVLVLAKVVKYVHKLQLKVRIRKPSMFPDLEQNQNFFNLTRMHIIRTEQRICVPEIFNYFDLQNPRLQAFPI